MTSLSGVRDLGFSGDLDLERDFGIGEASDKSLSISTLGKTCFPSSGSGRLLRSSSTGTEIMANS